MRLVPGPPPPRVSRAEAGRLLALSPQQISKLLKAGYLAELSIGRVARLCAAPEMRALPGERQPVLRQAVRPIGSAVDVGINAEMTMAEVADQCLGWWITDPKPWLDARLIPVTIAGWCVAVLAVNEVEGRTASPPVRIYFSGLCVGIQPDIADPETRQLASELSAADRAAVTAMLGARGTGRSGGPTAYLDEWSAPGADQADDARDPRR